LTIVSDKKPVAVSGDIMRRTDASIRQSDGLRVTHSGDKPYVPAKFTVQFDTYPDSDPRWGKTPLDDDWPGPSSY
jgi:hypothetical protein